MVEPKKPTGVGLEPHVRDFLDAQRQAGPYRKLSRSALVNMIIEEWAESQGTPIAPVPKPVDVADKLNGADNIHKTGTMR